MRYCRRTKSNMPDQSKSTGEVSTQAGSKRTSNPARCNWFEATRSSLSIPSQASWIVELLERLAADGPGSAPDDLVRIAAQHGHHVAVDRRDQVVGARSAVGESSQR